MILLVFMIASRADTPSLETRVSANGYGVSVFNGANAGGAVLDRFSDHLYQTPSEGADDTRDLLYDTYFGLAADGVYSWLTASDDYGTVAGTAMVQADRSSGGLAITEYDWVPMGLAGPGLVQLLHVENTGTATIRGVQVFSLHNFQLGRDDDGDGSYTDDEAIWFEDGALYEWGNTTGLVMAWLPLVPADSYSCDSVYAAINAGEDLDGRCGTASEPWTFDDQVGGFSWDLGDLAPGDDAWVGVSSGFDTGWDTTSMPALLAAWAGSSTPDELLSAEQSLWADWLAAGTPPSDMTAEESAVYDQSLVWLKAAQVREGDDAYGQIVASFPATGPDPEFDHTWNITWVRDSAYAARALAAAGYPDEAEAALAFLLQEGKSGYYASYLSGVDYGVSVCRTYGDGMEWSDDDGTGPNIELDGFGLVLWAVAGAVEARGDSSFLEAHRDALFSVADALAALLEGGTGAGLLVADSSIWERHWNGNQKHFTYSSAWAVRGLIEAAGFARTLGDTTRAATYADAAATIQAAMETLLVSDGVLAGNLEEIAAGAALDAAAVDAFNNDTLDPQGAVALASLEAWELGLKVATGQGYYRNDDGSAYDSQEWAFVDLRMSEAWRRACLPDAATALEDRVTAAATANDGALPEMFDPDDGSYEGPAPMLGFGAGVYALAMQGRAAADADCATDTGVGPDTGDTGASDTADTAETADSQPGDSDTEEQDSEHADTDSPTETGVTDSGSGASDDDFYKVPTGCSCSASDAAGRGWPGLLLGLLLLRRRVSPGARPLLP